jgi:hypothetical protein
MKSEIQQHMLDACRAMLRPIVRMLLRNGIPWRTFADLAKSVYVEVAGADYGIGGRPTNASRVSLLTGLTRREVKKQRDLLAGQSVRGPEKTNNAMRVLEGWFKDPDYLGDDGRPRPIRRDGGRGTFEALHHRYGGDVPAVAMLKELTKTGAVVETEDGFLRAGSRYYMPDPMDPEAILRSGSVLADVGRTISWNLARGEKRPSRFEGRASDPAIPVGRVPAFRALLEEKGQRFLEDVDDWLTANRAAPGETEATAVTRLGVGVYMIQDDAA